MLGMGVGGGRGCDLSGPFSLESWLQLVLTLPAVPLPSITIIIGSSSMNSVYVPSLFLVFIELEQHLMRNVL